MSTNTLFKPEIVLTEREMPSYQRILVPVNGSTTSERALQEAIKLAHGKAQIRLIYVLEEILPLAVEGMNYANNTALLESRRKAAEATLAQAADQIQNSGVTGEIALVDDLGQGVIDVINNEALDWQADLIVIGTHGRSGLTRLLLGSVAEGVVREASVPVLLIRA
jgi:nucleotide-binding universal stress UspA family protein